jgi:hypothetical protein
MIAWLKRGTRLKSRFDELFGGFNLFLELMQATPPRLAPGRENVIVKSRKKNKREPAKRARAKTSSQRSPDARSPAGSQAGEPLTDSSAAPFEPSTLVQDSTAPMDSDGHGHFRDLCLCYGDFNRPIFLEVIQDWFIRSAGKAELDILRQAVAVRAAAVGKGGKRGRPRAQDDSDWLASTKIAAWRHIVDGWPWSQIAEWEGMKPNQNNIKTIERTLSRRVERYAAIIWRACTDLGSWKASDDLTSNLARIEDDLKRAATLRAWLWVKAGLPFGRFPGNDFTEGCTKIVLTLVPRGEKAAAEEIISRANYRRQTRPKMSSPR